VHLADQLLLPMWLARGGRFKTMPLSRHALTNIDVLRRFGGPKINVEQAADGTRVVGVKADKSGP
jgi:RNA 3'-terminal phosphate cyclase (ATP)